MDLSIIIIVLGALTLDHSRQSPSMPIPPFNLRWLILLAVFACLVTALGSTEESEADLKEVKMQLNIEAFQKAVKKVREEKRISIKIETITECDQRDVLPGGCRHPIQVYPVLEGPPYIEWAFEKRYTITWGNVDDNYPQRFQWDTGYCGSVNKSKHASEPLFPPPGPFTKQ